MHGVIQSYFSTRAGVPTMCQDHDVHIPEEILKNLGRWSSSVFQNYRKNYTAALKARRFIEEELVAKLGNQNQKQPGLMTVSQDYLPPSKKPKFLRYK